MSFGELIKREAVAVIAAAAAFISCFLAPAARYVDYIDANVIGILFCLMTVVAGFSENGVLKALSSRAAMLAGDTRKLAAVLVFAVFFVSMLITNDVALIAFVPFTVMLYRKTGKSPLYTVVLQTAAANLGSAFTPFGNPQNLLLFSLSGLTAREFFGITGQITLVSAVTLFIGVMLIKKEPVTAAAEKAPPEIKNPRYLALYGILFVLCILSVFKVINIIYVLASVITVTAILQPEVFRRVDYGLLVTFACFFIFAGNVKNIPGLPEMITNTLEGREFEVSLIISQVISNVPAAVMLSGFTENYRELILGTDIGGLGTLIASLASLISYKSYTGAVKNSGGRFMAVFTAVNVIFLIILTAYAEIVIL